MSKSLNNNTFINKNNCYSKSSPSDFVSHDVSKALQEAREIITEGKARDNPNEQLIKDSTSIKVTKTGSLLDPIEVTVSRSRIVSKKNQYDDDLGSYSDSDIQTINTKECTSLLKNAESHDTLINAKNIDNDNSHTSVRYRRKHDELWRIDNDEVKGSVEDETQLEVDVKEEHCTDKGSQLIIKIWEAKWTAQHFDLLPDWLQDNEFLRTGHRPPLPSFAECFKSIWSLHTETGNIWTHLLGCIGFFVLAAWYLTHSDIQFQEKIVFSFFFIGAILCLGLSFTFHTVCCHSINVVRIFSKLDYMGISLLIIGSFIPWIYYGFYCRPEPKISYITMVVILGIGAVIVSLWDKFSESKYRSFRAAVFVTMGLSGLVPTLHFLYTDGMKRLIDENSFYWLIAMAILYLFGAFLYATRTPERFFPGRCDYLFQSHQLFHTCVVCAAFAHYYGISEMAMNRLTNSCDLSGSASFSNKISDEL